MGYTDLRATWPPLRVWAIFGVLGAGLFAGLFTLLYLKQAELHTPAEELFKQRLADLERRWQADTTSMKIIVIGQSLVRAGIAANDSTFKPFVSIYKIWENGAELEDFVKRPYLWETLKRLRSLGNTVLVVEHDPETIHAADHVIDRLLEETSDAGAGEAPAEVARAFSQ